MSILGYVQAKFSFRDPFQPSSFTTAVRFALPTSHCSLSKKERTGIPPADTDRSVQGPCNPPPATSMATARGFRDALGL
jgi:hypothetical protein